MPLVLPTHTRQPSAGDGDQESKKPRRSQRISSQIQPQENPATPLKDNNLHLPSPLTHRESTVTEEYKEATISPPEGRPSQIRHRTPVSSPSQVGLSSPPSDTQALSQYYVPPKSLSYEVEDEEAEGVWGYLVPIDHIFGETLVLRARAACPAPYPSNNFGKGGENRGRAEQKKKPNIYAKEELDYESNKRTMGFPASGYLIGRHPECGKFSADRCSRIMKVDPNVDRVLQLSTISNRHCIIFNENKNGKAIAIIEDLSSNGTFVNEAIIGRNKRRELMDGDQISVLDQARFMFYYAQCRESNAFRQQYKILQQLGKGHFATVYLCVERATGIQFAVKRFEKRPGDNEKSRTDGLQQEIGVLKSVSHPNMLCLKDTFDEEDGVYIILELAPEGELFNTIVMKQKLTEEETRKVFIQLFQGIKYLVSYARRYDVLLPNFSQHERNIVHRDIKPENILLADKNLSVKLADFGLAKIIGEESFTTTLCGTPSCRHLPIPSASLLVAHCLLYVDVAPEILENSKHRKYTRAVDVWSLGVVLYICLCGFPPFSDELNTPDNPYNLSQQIKMGSFNYPSPYWDSIGDPALELIDRMLTVDVEKRITIDECLEHPWITNREFKITDSTDGLTGAMDQLDFSKRKVGRERTLLSSINDVKVSKVIEYQLNAMPVKVFDKNPDGKRQYNQVATYGVPQEIAVNGAAATEGKEEMPAAQRQSEAFMEMGGKGDVKLFADDTRSRYQPNEVPR